MEPRIGPQDSESSGIDDKLDKLAEDIKRLPEKRKKALEDMMKQRLYSVRETLKILSISIETFRRWKQRGVIKTIKVGKFLRIPTEELERLLEMRRGFSVAEVAKLLSVSVITVRNLIKSEKLRAVRLSQIRGQYKIPKEEIERFIKEGVEQ